jgi:uncharacterized protein with HEPN domain
LGDEASRRAWPANYRRSSQASAVALKQAHLDVPWEKIHGLGNLLRHEYRRIDPEILWSIVTDHLSTLDAAAAVLLDRINSDSS